ncbi:MAG: glycerophosphodiester phosphodiesterase family protein [Sphingomonadaceae bacterium]
MRLSPFAPLDALIAPPPEPGRIAFLGRQPYAHRGLHSPSIVENSRAAFQAAIAVGHGIELDVQSARDGEAFVFHDDTLNRLTFASGETVKTAAHTLDQTQLRGSHETIPRLTEILAMVRGQVPLLIEIKAADAKVGVLCLSVRRALEGYRGDVAIMSFNPKVVAWFGRRAPRVTRGLVISDQGHAGMWQVNKRRALRRIAFWQAAPDFLAYDVRDLPSGFASAQRKRGLPILTWTVRTAPEERVAFGSADEIIYEKPATVAL